MYAVSAAFASKIRHGGLVNAYAELWDGSTRTAVLHVTGGNVVSDRTAAVPRSCSVTVPGFAGIIPDTGTLPAAATFADGDGVFGDGPMGDGRSRAIQGLVIPAVTEIRLFWSLTLDTGAIETVPLGRFRVSTVNFSHDANGGVEATITGYDVARSVAKAGYTSTYTIAQLTNVRTALLALLTSRVPGLSCTVPTTSYSTTRLAFLADQQANPWEDAQRMAWAAGWELLTTRTGGVVAQVPADPSSGSAVWTLDEATLLSVITDLDDEEAVNTVVVYGETSEDVPVRGVAQRTTGQWGTATIGVRTHYEQTEFVGSAGVSAATIQASLIAQGILNRLAGLTDTVELEAAGVLPHLDPGDLVAVTDGTLELSDTIYALERVVVDLNPSTPTRLTVSRRLA